MATLLALLATPLGGALAGIIGTILVSVLFLVLRALLSRFEVFAKRTKNKLDDEIVKQLKQLLDQSEPVTEKAVQDLLKEAKKKKSK